MNISIDFHKVTAGNCFLAAFLIYKARYIKLYRIMGAVNSLFIKNSLIPLYFHPYFLPILWYNTITTRKSSLSTASSFIHLGAVSIKAVAVALITSRDRSSQL